MVVTLEVDIGNRDGHSQITELTDANKNPRSGGGAKQAYGDGRILLKLV